MNPIENLFKKDHSFMILKYNCHLRFSETKESEIMYEAIVVRNNKLYTFILNGEHQKTFKENKNKFSLIYEDKEGAIYDYKDFKSYTKSLNIDLDNYLKDLI